MALTKITSAIIADGAITASAITDTSITAAKLHTTLDLTGKAVTVATATAGDNDTTVASTAFVSTAIANLADSAPSTLDTLNELAAALGDDANFSTTVTNSIALKSPLASPSFTGNATFAGAITASSIDVSGLVEGGAMFINAPDGGGAPAVTALLKLYGYEGRGAGIKIRDSANSASGASNREWFIGSGYNQGSFNIGYASDGSQSSYTAQNQFTITTAGLVGIGTHDPDGKLDIEGNFESSKALVLTNTQGTGKVSYLRSHGGNGETLALYHDGSRRQIWDSSGHIAFENGGTERMRINSSGNVGIGETSPDESLVINGGVKIKSTNYLSFTNTSDQTYIRAPASNVLAFGTDSTERLRITSAGNVGIGTASPSAEVSLTAYYSDSSQFHFGGVQAGISNNTYFNGSAWVNRSSGLGGAIFQMNNAGEFNFRRAGTGTNPTVSYSMTIDGSGNVGIGTTSPGARLHVNGDLHADRLQLLDSSRMGFGTIAAGASVGHTASVNEGIFWHSSMTDYGIWRTSGVWSGNYSQLKLGWSTGIVIDGGNAYGNSGTRIVGDLICGAGTGYPHSASINSAYLHSSGDTSQPAARFTQSSTSNSYTVMRLRHESTTAGRYVEFRTDENFLTGIIQDVSGTMQYQSSSDSRLKENVESMTEGLTEVLAMNPVKFTWKDIVTENKTVDMEGAESRGFLAQELNEQYPWAVSEGGEDEKENPWSVDYGKLTPILVKAIQEQQTLIESLTARITTLEG